jgi:hypothetical protein
MELYEKYLGEAELNWNKYLRKSIMEHGRTPNGDDIWSVISPDDMILMEIYDYSLAKMIKRSYGIRG